MATSAPADCKRSGCSLIFLFLERAHARLMWSADVYGIGTHCSVRTTSIPQHLNSFMSGEALICGGRRTGRRGGRFLEINI